MIRIADILPHVPDHMLEWCWRSGYRSEKKLAAAMRTSPEAWRRFLAESGVNYDELLAKLPVTE